MEKDSPVYIFRWSPKIETDRFHAHDHLELGYCISGKGTFHFGEKTYEAQAGDVFVVNNLERHAARSDADDPSDYYFLFFNPTSIEQVDPELLQPFVYRPKRFQNKIPSSEPAARQIGALVRDIWAENERKQEGFRGVMLAKLLEICALLLRHYGRQTSSGEWLRVWTAYRRMRAALDYIRDHFREPIALEDVASLLGLSPSRTRHYFKEKLGEGFKEYVLRVRINEAKKLLACTDWPIARIMHDSGFQSHAPFYRAFRQFVGMAPQEYRKRCSKIALFEKGPVD